MNIEKTIGARVDVAHHPLETTYGANTPVLFGGGFLRQPLTESLLTCKEIISNGHPPDIHYH